MVLDELYMWQTHAHHFAQSEGIQSPDQELKTDKGYASRINKKLSRLSLVFGKGCHRAQSAIFSESEFT